MWFTTHLYPFIMVIMVNMGNHPKMALFQVSELLYFAQIYGKIVDCLLLGLPH
jgi:hypothetical protein